MIESPAMTLRSRGVVVALAATALLALAASPALAAKDDKKKDSGPGKVETETAQTATTADNQAVSVTMQCPKGTKAVGGGFVSSFATAGASITDFNVITDSRRSGKKAWIVSAYRFDNNANPGPTLPLTGEVYCRSGIGNISETSLAQGTSPGLALFAPDATCSRKKTITGGGFSFAVPNFSTNHFFQHANRPLGSVGWSIDAIGGTPGVSATAFAYCQKLEKALKQRTAQAALPGPVGTLTSVDSPACPGKRSATAGGWSAPELLGGLGSPLVVESRRAEKSWHVAALSLNGGPNGFVNSHAVCS